MQNRSLPLPLLERSVPRRPQALALNSPPWDPLSLIMHTLARSKINFIAARPLQCLFICIKRNSNLLSSLKLYIASRSSN
jgi:hypothetical protein